MAVTVKVFAGLRERAGWSEREIEAATVADVWAQLGLGDEPPGLLYAVNKAYAPRESSLADGDEVALIPPVSGGSFRLVSEPLDVAAVLREADPEHTDVLFCLTGSDQANIIASLVGRSLGFGRVVTKINDPEFEHVCIELGLEDMIIPARTVGRHLAEMFEGTNPLEISAMIKAEARVFSFAAREEDARPISELGLPDKTRVICIYRDEKFLLPGDDDRLKAGDEVVLITHVRNLPALAGRWAAK